MCSRMTQCLRQIACCAILSYSFLWLLCRRVPCGSSCFFRFLSLSSTARTPRVSRVFVFDPQFYRTLFYLAQYRSRCGHNQMFVQTADGYFENVLHIVPHFQHQSSRLSSSMLRRPVAYSSFGTDYLVTYSLLPLAPLK